MYTQEAAPVHSRLAARPAECQRGMQVLGGIVYGGHLTDTSDARVLMALLKSFVRPELLQEGHSFAMDAAYRRPDAGGLQSYRWRTWQTWQCLQAVLHAECIPE